VQVTRATFIPLLASGNAERVIPDTVVDDFCADLSVIYTFGPQFGRRVVTHSDLDQMQLPMPMLRRSAHEHLEVLSSRAEFHGQPPALMLSFDGLESSLVLASDFWTRLEGAVPGELVVGVPARDVVIVTGSQSGAGMEKVRRCVERVFFAGGEHPLSRSLLVRRGGAWEPFDRPRQGGRRGAGPAHQLGVGQPPRQYQEHNSWPSEQVRPVSGPADRRHVRPPAHPGHPVHPGHPMRPAAAANPVRPPAAPLGAVPPGLRPVSMGGPMTNHGGPMTNHGAGRGFAPPPQRPAHGPADVAPRSAMPYSAMPYSATPYSATPYSVVPQSAMPYSAVPFSAAPFPTSSASSYTPSPELRSAPAYDRPKHDKPAYDAPAHDKGGYDEPAYDQPQYDDPKPSYRDDRYSTGSQPSYRDDRYSTGSQPSYRDDPYSTGSQPRYADPTPTSDAGSARPEYPSSWGWSPEQSASRPEWKASPRARFSSR
jgi:hypothetical protein